jgi:hypothetical protein
VLGKLDKEYASVQRHCDVLQGPTVLVVSGFQNVDSADGGTDDAQSCGGQDELQKVVCKNSDG